VQWFHGAETNPEGAPELSSLEPGMLEQVQTWEDLVTLDLVAEHALGADDVVDGVPERQRAPPAAEELLVLPRRADQIC